MLNDSLKDDSRASVSMLSDVRTLILSGDGNENVAKCAEIAGINEFYGELKPDEKLAELSRIIGETKGTTVYIGDGINDAPAIALADVGIAMGGIGQDAAVEAADAVIMNDSLSVLPRCIKIAKKTKLISTENIIFAIFIKVLAMVLSVLGVSAIWFAVFADVGVCLLAILNSLRLINYGGKS